MGKEFKINVIFDNNSDELESILANFLINMFQLERRNNAGKSKKSNL